METEISTWIVIDIETIPGMTDVIDAKFLVDLHETITVHVQTRTMKSSILVMATTIKRNADINRIMMMMFLKPIRGGLQEETNDGFKINADFLVVLRE